MELIRGIVDPKVELKLVETKDKSLVDGENIIGVMEGNFFVPGGVSRNKRFYSKNLWNRTLSSESVQEKLTNKSMYGTIGHDTPVNDESLAKGLLTHITDKLYIDEKGNGIGRALVLNTTAGRNLKTVLGAGGKVYVSSRALGTFEGKTSHGVPKVKEDDYDLKGFDAVLDPGFLEANPALKESLEYPEDSFKSMINECYSILVEELDEPETIINEDKQNEIIKEEITDMDKTVLETITKMTAENAKVKSALEDALKGQEKLEAENSVLQTENESFKTQLQEQEDEVAKKKKEDDEEDEEEKKEAKIKSEAALSIVKTIHNFMEEEDMEDEEDDEKKKKKKEDDAVEAFKKFTEDVGTAKQIKSALETLESKLDEYKKFEGEYGTNEEIEKLLNAFETLGEKQVSAKKESKADKLATELGVPKEKVEALLAKDFDEEAITEFFKDMKESLKVKNTYGRNKINEDKVTDEDPNNPFRKPLGESVLQRMHFVDDDATEYEAKEENLGESILKKLM